MKTIYSISFIALIALLYACNDSKDTPKGTTAVVSVPLQSVTSGPAHTWTEYPVSLEGRTDIEVRPQVSGYLQNLYVDEGAFVKAGQLLFKIDDRPYQEALNNALGNLNGADAALINAKLEVEKLAPLVEGKVISEYQLKTAKAGQKIAEANKRQAEAAVASARINLSYTLIRAPLSGYIGRLPKKQGSLLAANDPEPLTTLSDIAEIHAYFSISEADFIAFRSNYKGATVADKVQKLPPLTLVLPDHSEYESKGTIDMVDGKFNKTTGAITLRATFTNKSGVLRSGNTGKVRLGIPFENALLVPQSATVEVQDKIFVYTVNNANKVSRIPISILGKSGTDYLVKDGLRQGDRIVLKGFESLQDGALVSPEKPSKTLALK